METVQQSGNGQDEVRRTQVSQDSDPYDELDRLPIAGTWRKGRSSKRVTDLDPYTGETLLEMTGADGRDVEEAYETAQRAQRAWAATRPQDRRALFLRAALLLERRKEEIIGWLIRESGSTRLKATMEWQMTHAMTLETARIPFNAESLLLPASVEGKESRVYREPLGVATIISPWNFPLHLSNRAVAPALALGNTVVLKPASETPLTGGLLLARLYQEAGLPEEVLQVVVGSADEIGQVLVEHPVPRIISFTGSTAAGRTIAERASRHLKRVTLELGGNTPFIVLEDADLGRAVDAAVAGKFIHQGQICMAVNRILVAQERYDEFRDRFTERVRGLKVGNPAEPDTAIGPVINRQQLDAIQRRVEGSLSQGARAVLRGEPQNLVLPPAVLADVTNDMPTAKEEVFGPVASLLRFSDEEEGIALANDTEYGLSAAVWSGDLEDGVRVAKRIQAGMTHVNDWPVNDEVNAPFGGEKSSGLGRFNGRWVIEEFSTPHWISVQEDKRRYPL